MPTDQHLDSVGLLKAKVEALRERLERSITGGRHEYDAGYDEAYKNVVQELDAIVETLPQSMDGGLAGAEDDFTVTHGEGYVLKSAVCALLKQRAEEHADMALEGEPDNARGREAMEAALTRARHTVAFMPVAVAAAPAHPVLSVGDEVERFAEALFNSGACSVGYRGNLRMEQCRIHARFALSALTPEATEPGRPPLGAEDLERAARAYYIASGPSTQMRTDFWDNVLPDKEFWIAPMRAALLALNLPVEPSQ